VRFSFMQKLLLHSNRQATKKSASAPMKSILSVAGCQTVNFMIGCKPNANSRAQRCEKRLGFRPRQRMNETS
jgi:hypothetical protein